MWRGKPPASEDVLRQLRANCAFTLPPAYLDLLRFSNGGEGDISIEPDWCCLWAAEEVIENNKDYEVSEHLPGFFGFGSNGEANCSLSESGTLSSKAFA